MPLVTSPQNFSVYAGDTLTLAMTIYNDQGVPLNLTGTTVEWTAGKSDQGPPVISKATGGRGINLVDPIHGYVEIDLLPADTLLLTPGDYRHQCEVTLAGVVSTVAAGAMTLLADLV